MKTRDLKVGDYVYVSWYNIHPWEGYGKIHTISKFGKCYSIEFQNDFLGYFEKDNLRKIDSIEILEAKLKGLI